MRDDGIVNVLEQLVDTDLTTLDRAEVSAVLAGLRRLRGWVDAGELQCTRRLHELSDAERSESACQALVNESGHRGRDAEAIQDRADLCDEHDDLEASLAAGMVTSAHLDAIGRALAKLDGDARAELESRLDEIHRWAAECPVSVLEFRLRNLVRSIRAAHTPVDEAAELAQQRDRSEIKHWVDRDDGMHHWHVSLDPLRSAKLRSALNAEVNAARSKRSNSGQPWGSFQVDALIAAMAGGSASNRSPELVVVIDADTLASGERHVNSVCETTDGSAVPPSFAQQIACEATITVAGLDRRGRIYDVVHQRSASRRQRTALAAMYATCAFPGCCVPVTDTISHHIRFVSEGGLTELDNLIPLCSRHHHAIHDEGWQLHLDTDDRLATWMPPDGGRPLVESRPTAVVEPSPEPKHRRAGIAVTRRSMR